MNNLKKKLEEIIENNSSLKDIISFCKGKKIKAIFKTKKYIQTLNYKEDVQKASKNLEKYLTENSYSKDIRFKTFLQKLTDKDCIIFKYKYSIEESENFVISYPNMN